MPPQGAKAQAELDELNRTYRPALVSFFLRRVRSPADAEDLAQDVLIRVAQADRTDIRSAQAYVFRIAVNLLRDRARREKHRLQYRETLVAEADLGVDALDPCRIVAGERALESMAAAIQELPELTRNIFICYRIENISRAEIASAFQLTERVVDSHLARAMAALVGRLRRDSEST